MIEGLLVWPEGERHVGVRFGELISAYPKMSAIIASTAADDQWCRVLSPEDEGF